MIIKIFNRYKAIPIQMKAALWYVICNIAQKAVAFLVTPIFTRIMSTEDFGLYSVYNSWYWVVSVLATLNLYCGVFNNGLFEYKNTRDAYTSSMQGLSTTISTILFVLYLFTYKGVYKVTGITFTLGMLMFLEVLTAPALSFWLARQRFEYKYKAMIAITLGISIIRPFISVITVLISRNKGIARIVSYVGIQFAVGLIFYIYNFYKGRKYFDWKIWKGALLFNLPLIPHYLSQTLLNQADKLMINNFCGKSAAGIYQLAYTVAMVTTIINTSINNSIIPWIYTKLESKKAQDIRNISTMLLLIIAAVNLFVILFAKEAIWALGGKRYSSAVFVLPSITWSVFFMFLYNLFGDVEFYYKKSQYTMIGSTLACILNIGLNYIFIPLFGYYAAGYTTLVSYISLSFFHYIFMIKIENEEKLPSLFNYKLILITSFSGSMLMILVQLSNYNFFIRCIIAVFLGLIFLSKRKEVGDLIKIFYSKSPK